MKMRWLGILLLMVFAATGLSGCGGSTQGTGGITVEGRLLEVNGAPIGGVTVFEVASGASTTTAADGAFMLEAPLGVPTIELLFQAGQVIAPASISVPANTRRVAARFKLDRERQRVDAEEVDIDEDDGSGAGAGDDDGGDDSGSDDDIDDDSPGDDGDDNGDDNGHGSGDDDGDDNGSGGGDDGGDPGDDDGDGDDDSPGSGGSGGGTDKPDGERREAEGPLQAVSATHVVVGETAFTPVAATRYRDANGGTVGIGYFSVGMEVKARGVIQGGVLVLERLEEED